MAKKKNNPPRRPKLSEPIYAEPRRIRTSKGLNFQELLNKDVDPATTQATIHASDKTKHSVYGRTEYIPREIRKISDHWTYRGDIVDPDYKRFASQQQEIVQSVLGDENLFKAMNEVLRKTKKNLGKDDDFDKYVKLVRMSTNTLKKFRKEIDVTSVDDMADLKEAMQFLVTGYDHLLEYHDMGYDEALKSKMKGLSLRVRRQETLIFQHARHQFQQSGIGSEFPFYTEYVNVAYALQEAYNASKHVRDFDDPYTSESAMAMATACIWNLKSIETAEAESKIREAQEREDRRRAIEEARKERDFQRELRRFTEWSIKVSKGTETQRKLDEIEAERRRIEEERRKEEEAYQQFVQSIIQSTQGAGAFGPMSPEEILEQTGFEKRSFLDKILRVLREDTLYKEISNLVSGVAGSLMAGAKQAIAVSSGLYASISNIFNFSDFFNFPFQALIATMTMGVNALSVTMEMTGSALGGVIGIFNFIAGLQEDDMEETFDERHPGRSTAIKHGDENPFKSILKLTLNSIRFIFMAFSIGFSALASVMKFGMTMFFDFMTIINKILKELVKTSDLFREIENIFNLALIMFFMPFFNTFGNVLLDTVFNLVLWARDFHENNSLLMQSLNQTATDIGKVFQSIYTDVGGINEDFTNIATDAVKELVPPMKEFIGYFTDTLLEHIEDFKGLIDTGIDVGKELLRNGILEVMLHYGIEAMTFLSENAPAIVSIINTAGNIVERILNMFTAVMNHFWLFCVAMGSALVSLFMMAGFVAGNVGTLLNIASKVSAPLARQLLAQGITKYGLIGGGLGAILGGVFYAYFFAFAEGGYIPATTGGLLSIVAEKETEYIIPESKVSMIRGHNNIVITFNDDVYMFDNPKSELNDAIRDITYSSNYR